MTTSVSPESIKQIFTEARTHQAWLEREVGDDVLFKIFDVAKWGPTSVNSLPARFLFLKSSAAKSDLLPALSPTNVQKVQVAPVTAVIAFDEKFYDELPALFTAFDAKALFLGNPTLSAETAFRNSALQGAYFMLAARALGLDVGPMSGFDNAKVDEIFFGGTSWKSNFLCNIGYGDPAKLFPRGARLSFDQAAKIA
jgi:3-hydroxypropanoate dehydrogenase